MAFFLASDRANSIVMSPTRPSVSVFNRPDPLGRFSKTNDFAPLAVTRNFRPDTSVSEIKSFCLPSGQKTY